MKLTAATITDAQIRELRGRADAQGDIVLVYLCCDALRILCEGRERASDFAAREARARCADLLNARTK